MNGNDAGSAPLFTVQAVKSHKPNPDSPNYDTLLPFKRKQIITVLDWDEKRDAVYGEYDGKKGWFPSSFGKIISGPNKGNSSPVITISHNPEDKISQAAAVRNAVPIATTHRENSEKRASGSLNATIPAPSLSPRDTGSSPRRLGNVLGSSISSILPKAKSSDVVDYCSDQIVMKNEKNCNNEGVPLLIVHIVEYCRTTKVMDMKDLFRKVSSKTPTRILAEQFASERVNLSCHNDKTITGCLKHYFLNLSEPLLTFDLYQSFTAASEIEEFERKFSQFHYLLEMIPLQNFNVTRYVAKFLQECTSKSSVNNFDLDTACRMFGGLFCREHTLHSVDEEEIVKSSQVTKFIIENNEELLKEFKNILDKKTEKQLESRRKKQKETTSNYNRSEEKRAKKEERKKEKARKKNTLLVTQPDRGHARRASTDSIHSSPILGSKRALSSRAPLNIQSPETDRSSKFPASAGNSPRSPEITPPPKIVVPEVLVQKPPTSTKPSVVDNRDAELAQARTLTRFYQIGFYVMLLVFVLSHIIRSIL